MGRNDRDPARPGCLHRPAFDASDDVDPAAALARIKVELRVHRDSLRLPGKRVCGAWDPLLRRIDLYGCDESRSDLDLVLGFGHELYHALGDEAEDKETAEAHADQFAEAWCAQLGPAGVTAWAGALRQLCGDASEPQDETPHVR
jgi:hypothetical protein